MGKHQLRLLKFALRYPGWHSYGKDKTTVQAVKSLVKIGLMKVNESRQFSLNITNDVQNLLQTGVFCNDDGVEDWTP